MNSITNYFYNNTNIDLAEQVAHGQALSPQAQNIQNFNFSAVPQVKNSSALIYRGNQELRMQEIKEIHHIRKTLEELNELTDQDLNVLLGNDFNLPAGKKREIIRDSIISTTLAYRNLDDYVRLFGEMPAFEVMVYDEKSNTEVKKTYEFEKRVSLVGAVGYVVFKDQTGEMAPLLMFNGTYRYTAVKGQGNTVLADLDRRGIGYTAIEENQKKLEEELYNLSEKGQKKVHCVGHSLGGATSTRVGITFPQYVKSVAAFESPKMDKSTSELYEKSEERALIRTYNSENDPVSKFGEVWVGDVFRITPSEKNKQSLMDAHEKSVAMKVGTQIQQLNPKEYGYLDTLAWSVQYASGLGGLLYGTGLYARRLTLSQENGIPSYINSLYKWYSGEEYSSLSQRVNDLREDLKLSLELDKEGVTDNLKKRHIKQLEVLREDIAQSNMPSSYKETLYKLLPPEE